jgi:hypothetical protein
VRRQARLIAGAVIAVAALVAMPLRAQRPDSARAGVGAPDTATARTRRPARINDQPPVSPRRAFLYSLALPGLGQAALDRRYTGAGFFLVEALSLALVYRSNEDLRLAKQFLGDSVPLTYAIDPTTGIAQRNSAGDPVVATWQQTRYTNDLVRARKLHVEDWIAVVIFNHLVSGADAFVAAQLWDLPSHVAFRAVPLMKGGTALSMSFSFR